MRGFESIAAAFIVAAAVVAADPPPIRGQEPSPELAELRARLDALERRNFELEAAVRRLPAVGEAFPPAADADDLGVVREASLARADLFHAQPAPPAAGTSNPLSMSASWNNGLELKTKDGRFRVHVGGRSQFDAGWFSAPDNLDANPAATGLGNLYGNGVDLRRARFRVDGTMFECIDWAAEYDWVNAVRVRNAADTGPTDHTVPAFTDLWWQFKDLPLVGHVRIGNHKEPIGFEHMSSSRFLPFLERSYNQDAFYGGFFNGFTPGVSAFDTMFEERGTWAIGVFKPTDNVFAVSNHGGDYSVTGRVTANPWFELEGAEVLHLGFSARQASTVGDRVRFRTRDAVRVGLPTQWPVPADTGVLAGDNELWFNFEAAAVFHQFTFQAEYLMAQLYDAAPLVGGVPGASVGTLVHHGGYAQVFYFLTGEFDHYNRKTAVFERVTPRRNFSPLRCCRCGDAGWGAWQVGLRYNFLDLNDEGVNGGELHNLTAGLNWFLNPNMKIQFNYMATRRESALPNADGWIHGWGARLAHDF